MPKYAGRAKRAAPDWSVGPSPELPWPRRLVVSTPLQHLLDSGHALVDRSPPILASGLLGPRLPAWNDFQTAQLDLGDPELGARHDQTAEVPMQEMGITAKSEHTDSEYLQPEHARAAPPETATTTMPEAFEIPQGFRPFQATLDESVVDALINALYDALPADLEISAVGFQPEVTTSGNVLGRHQAVTSRTLVDLETELEQTEPRQLVRGPVDGATIRVTLHALTELPLDVLPDEPAQRISKSTVLGEGEACFLRAQSALWAWRTHRQNNLQLHSAGPPVVNRNVLIEQRIGPLTLLVGCRVTEQHEAPRLWGFTLGSLRGQVLRSRETFLIEWQPGGQVVFTCTSEQSIALATLGFLAPVHNAVRRMMVKSYIRNMLEMSAGAEAS
ncbi:DUF1990 family protein [Deinococcus sp.]|uniref:DUF1990 family protein n=1 Tax=Deinococcus sp. TaxID=47478 RepID=UPI0025B90A9C|nr:DUF1990 family protein [Deinococcus sp.]